MGIDNTDIANMHWQHDLLSSIEVGIVVLDREFNVEVWNQFMENHSSVRPRQINGKNLFEFFPDLDKAWFTRKCEPVFSMRSPAFIIWEQRPYVFKFGTSRPITSTSDVMYQNVTIFPLASLTGKVDKVCVLVYDVTDQALAKQNIEGLNERLREVSRVDGLTGLFNRRYWQERFEREFKMALRHNPPMCAIMLDIDHFKKVNDTYGHHAGDLVIQRLAKLVKLATRETDIPGRYGGEEFAVVLPDTTEKNAFIVAERLRKLVSLDAVQYEDIEIKFTVSIGIAQFLPKYKRSTQWLEDADKALYYAKEHGRNRVALISKIDELKE
ncbi:diguanylate cyclase [Glaciecola sp. MH2013]|uniref:sensor domain-containing diguanylate cyclase n=1 Tax=Glaciecola sp. MH2013 TaxID=2785524 RepID=UPI00189F29D0|nr:sensor domain-containing diguanylate cyclase [Glaciecola sp. MH2013]MBF7073867.1 diguanylate cyclase [Glaciecola sp. MH2013]